MKAYPLIKFVLCFIPGIIFANYIEPEISLIYTIAIVITVLCMVLIFISNKYSNISVLLPFMLYVLAFISGAAVYTIDNNSSEYLLPQSLLKEKNFTAFGTITNVELKRENELIFFCRTDSIKMADKYFARKANLLCKIKDESKRRRDSIYSIILPGNYISMTGTYAKGRDKRNPGEFDYNKYLNENGISGILVNYNCDDLNITGHESNFFKSIIFSCRKYLDGRISALHDDQTAGLLRGLVLADRSDIDYDTKNNFVNTGVVHVLAVSGLHVAYITLMFMFLFGRFNPVIRTILIATGILIYMFLTGSTPSVVRATIMSAVVLLSYISNRSTNVYNSLAVSALVILVFNPADLFNTGFQLSYVAVLSIALLYPVFKLYIESFEGLNKHLKKLLLFAAVSISAQIGTLPFTMAYFSKLSLSSIFANLIVIPLTGAQLAVAFFALAVDIISSQAAYLISGANDLFTWILYAFVNFSGEINYSFITVRQFTLLDSIIYYFFFTILFLFIHRVHWWWGKVGFVLLTVLCIVILSSFDNKELFQRGKLNVYMIDVGQGDSFLISFPNGKTALIDAGEATAYFDNGERVILPLLDYLGIDKVDYGFISHMDSDHYSGFVSLIHEGRIDAIYKPIPDSTKEIDLKFDWFVKDQKVTLKYYKTGYIKIDGTKIHVLSSYDIPGWNKLSTNNRSALLKIEYGSTSYLFTGDIEHTAEKYYSKKYCDILQSDVLKVSHHGSLTATSEKFINIIKPKISLISAGIKNKFRLPSKIILNRLNSAGSIIRRTDLEGGVLYQSDGDSLTCVNWKNIF